MTRILTTIVFIVMALIMTKVMDCEAAQDSKTDFLGGGADERGLQGFLDYGSPACPDHDGGLCDSNDKSKYIVCFKGFVFLVPETRCANSNFYYNLLKSLGLAQCGCCTKEEDPDRPNYCLYAGAQESESQASDTENAADDTASSSQITSAVKSTGGNLRA